MLQYAVRLSAEVENLVIIDHNHGFMRHMAQFLTREIYGNVAKNVMNCAISVYNVFNLFVKF